MTPEDWAQKIELAEYEHTQSRAILKCTSPSLTHCEDCGEQIPKARRKAIRGVTRCVACKQQQELNDKRGLL